ncbi:MAG: hypothetical protein WAK29_09825 [Terriglobales bacterium]
MRLAQQTGFKQAHISNFLNRKRGLSTGGMDRVLNVQHISVLDLIDPAEVNKRASILPPGEDEFSNIAVADIQVAASEPLIMSMHVQDVLKIKKSFLKRLKPKMEGDRFHWERFVAIRADAHHGVSMYPRIISNAALLLDRHYNSLSPYRKRKSNIYAVRKDGTCTIRYLEHADNCLVLRPHSPTGSIEVLALGKGQKPSDYIVGRVCYVETEV